MIRTVYIASVLGILTFFVALALGIAWGLVIEKDGLAILAPSFISIASGLLIGVIAFGLGLLFFRTKKPKAETGIMREVDEAAQEVDMGELEPVAARDSGHRIS